MHEWHQVDRYHMQYGKTEWRISKSINVPLPYCLHFEATTVACFKTADEAKAHHEKVMDKHE